MNNRGSTLVIAVAMLAALATSAYITLSSTNRASEMQTERMVQQQTQSVSQAIAAVLSNNDVCLNGFDGATGAENGLVFLDSAGAPAKFSPSLANSATGQAIEIPSPYSNGVGRSRFAANLAIPRTKLTLNKLYIYKSDPDPTTPDAYIVKVKARFDSALTDMSPIRPRNVVDLKLTVNGTGDLIDCSYHSSEISNQTMCENMGCVYSPSADGSGNCNCKLAPVTCPAGRYIASFSGSTGQCTTAPLEKTCVGTPNSFLVAFDSNGNPICAKISSCPTGTSTTGTGGAAIPPECHCNVAAENFEGGVCGLPINGVCGTAHNQALVAAPTLPGELCTAGMASVVTGFGPWNWSCNGRFGGTTDPCNATVFMPPVAGVCGASSGSTFATAPTANLCNVGTATAVTGTGPWSWTCPGLYGGSTDNCSASYSPPAIPGVCGTAGGVAVSSAPTANLCNAGVPSAVAGTGPWTWTCAGIGGGADAPCNAPPLPVAGVCGTANNITVATAPTANLCTTGAPSAVAGVGPWTWTCAGIGGAADAACNAPIVAGACGGAHGWTWTNAATADAQGLCSAGTPNIPSLVGYSAPWYWWCNAQACGASQAACGPATGGTFADAAAVAAAVQCSSGAPGGVQFDNLTNTFWWGCGGNPAVPSSGAFCTANKSAPSAMDPSTWNGRCYFNEAGACTVYSCAAYERGESNPTACESGSGNPLGGAPGMWTPPAGVNCTGTRISKSGCYSNYNFICTDGRAYLSTRYSCTPPLSITIIGEEFSCIPYTVNGEEVCFAGYGSGGF